MDAAEVSIVILGAMMLIQALTMSLLRVAGKRPSAGAEDEHTAFFTKWHKAQQLNTEYAPVFALLMLMIHVRTVEHGAELGARASVACYGAVATRIAFSASVLALSDVRKFSWPKSISAALCYIFYAWLVVEAAVA